MAAETDWIRIGLDAGIGIVSGAVGMISGAFRSGRRSAKNEQNVKEDYTGKIAALREETRTAMATHVADSEDRTDLLVDQFKESFDGIRRQIDDHRLHTETRFLAKDDFRDFIKEYRDDQRRTDVKLDRLLGAKQ